MEPTVIGPRDPPAAAAASAQAATHSRACLVEQRKREVEQAEAELHVALHVWATADEIARRVERALRKAWDTASAAGGQGAEDLDQVAELRARRADVMQQKLEAHRAADLAAERVRAARLALEGVEAEARHLGAEVAKQETTVAVLRRRIATAEQQMALQREVLAASEKALRQLHRQLSELAGS